MSTTLLPHASGSPSRPMSVHSANSTIRQVPPSPGALSEALEKFLASSTTPHVDNVAVKDDPDHSIRTAAAITDMSVKPGEPIASASSSVYSEEEVTHTPFAPTPSPPETPPRSSYESAPGVPTSPSERPSGRGQLTVNASEGVKELNGVAEEQVDKRKSRVTQLEDTTSCDIINEQKGGVFKKPNHVRSGMYTTSILNKPDGAGTDIQVQKPRPTSWALPEWNVAHSRAWRQRGQQNTPIHLHGGLAMVSGLSMKFRDYDHPNLEGFKFPRDADLEKESVEQQVKKTEDKKTEDMLTSEREDDKVEECNCCVVM